MRKKRKIDIGDVNMVTSSEEETYSGSSPHFAHLCISFLPLPLADEPSTEDDGKLVPGCRNSSKRELQNMIEKWKAFVSKVVKRQKVLIRDENEVLYKQKEKLTEKLEVVQVKNDELSSKVMVEKERNEALDAELKRIAEEYKATVVVGPFNAPQVDFDALYEVDMYKSCFNGRFPSGVGWDEFASKWKNLKDFYLDEGPSESIVMPNDKNITTTLTENIEVVEREDDITRDLEGERICLK
ncbi:hypothetical protein GOBAR_AA19173 [Gossypium barbadense]|uniref:Uncharacterized protein n=1 Tax=Gossypium barbadense TaxID=3634 RepID=A0A2P5XDT5_GOSBA|nr:hypothetical protein GOBAR_AA19173 [Gossypium barbadense]